MPTFQIFGARNGRVHDWTFFEAYDLTKTSGTLWTLEWDEGNYGPLDPESTPAELRLTYGNGIITRIDYHTEDGTLLARMGGLSLNTGFFEWAIGEGRLDPQDIFDLLSEGGLTVTGGSQSNAQWDHHDDITTSRWNDVVNARSGNDFIKDFGGADRYDGGSGFDTLTYENWQRIDPVIARGLRADLAAGTVRGPDGRVDTLTGIEGIRGTFRGDVLRGSARDEYFEGGRGADVIDGRGGSDGVGYGDRDDGPGVRVNLRTGVGSDQFRNRDTLIGIENVQGSPGEDILIDNAKSNDLSGAGGDDLLIFWRGSDRGQGGDGGDLFAFQETDFGADFIEDFDPGEDDLIAIAAATTFSDLTVTTDANGTSIALNGSSSFIFLEGYFGPVEPYLLLGLPA